jgi:transposase InsO family protein
MEPGHSLFPAAYGPADAGNGVLYQAHAQPTPGSQTTSRSRSSAHCPQQGVHRFGPHTKWVSDPTVVGTSDGWLDLAVVRDLFSRRVVGWAMGEHHDEALVSLALDMALMRRDPPALMLLRSDHGSPSTRVGSQRKRADRQMVASMSNRGECDDNAARESFFRTFQGECVDRTRFATRQEARQTIFDAVECLYNRIRRHSTLTSVSPINAGGQTPVSQSADDALRRPLVTMTNTVVFHLSRGKQWLSGLPRRCQGEAKQPCSPLGRLRHSPTLLRLNWPRNRRCVVKNEPALTHLAHKHLHGLLGQIDHHLFGRFLRFLSESILLIRVLCALRIRSLCLLASNFFLHPNSLRVHGTRGEIRLERGRIAFGEAKNIPPDPVIVPPVFTWVRNAFALSMRPFMSCGVRDASTRVCSRSLSLLTGSVRTTPVFVSYTLTGCLFFCSSATCVCVPRQVVPSRAAGFGAPGSRVGERTRVNQDSPTSLRCSGSTARSISCCPHSRLWPAAPPSPPAPEETVSSAFDVYPSPGASLDTSRASRSPFAILPVL